MKSITKALAKGTIATVAAGAMAMAASPAHAQWRDYDDDDIDVGDVIAGAVIIGGIAAAISAIDGDDDYYDGRYYRGRGSARNAVEQCVYAAERNASRYSWGGRANVTEIRKVDRDRDGYEINGRIEVNQWDRGWGRDRWYDRDRWDRGRFECRIRYGRVVDLDYSGIRGL